MRCNGCCCLSLHELMVVSTQATALHVTFTGSTNAATTPQQLFSLLHACPAFDVKLYLTLQYLVSQGWRCCDGSKCAHPHPHPSHQTQSTPLLGA